MGCHVWVPSRQFLAPTADSTRASLSGTPRPRRCESWLLGEHDEGLEVEQRCRPVRRHRRVWDSAPPSLAAAPNVSRSKPGRDSPCRPRCHRRPPLMAPPRPDLARCPTAPPPRPVRVSLGETTGNNTLDKVQLGRRSDALGGAWSADDLGKQRRTTR
jgi:hypothetical protein